MMVSDNADTSSDRSASPAPIFNVVLCYTAYGMSYAKIHNVHTMVISSFSVVVVVVVCLPRPMEGMGRLQFSDLFTELPVPPQAAGVVGTFNVLDIYPSEHYGLLFFVDLTDAIFLQGLPVRHGHQVRPVSL